MRHCRSITIQANTWATLCKHEWNFFFEREVDSEGQQYSKNKKIMYWVGPPYPSRGRRSRINLIGLVKKESKTGKKEERKAHTGIDTTGMEIHLADATLSIWMQSVEVYIFMKL